MRTTRLAGSGCTCPYHGTDLCDCQMVVLLVYQEWMGAPATVVLRGYQGQTWAILAEVPEAKLEETIIQSLAPAWWPCFRNLLKSQRIRSASIRW